MAKTGFGNFDYTCQGTWRGQPHNFSITGNHSGSAFSAAEAPTFMTGAASPYALSFAPFQGASSISVVQAKYYDGKASAPIWEATYDTDHPAPAALVPTAAAFSSSGTSYSLPLETCVILQSPVGFNSKSKPIYCRKFLRGAPGGSLVGAGHESVWSFETAVANAAAHAMGDGTWYGNRVYISPTGRQGNAGWTALTQIGNHQIPRGKKRKTPAAGFGSTVAQKIAGLLAAGDTGAALAILASL